MKKAESPNITLIFFAFAFFMILLSLFSKYSFQSAGITQIAQLRKSRTPTVYKLKTTADFSRTVECNYSDATASISAIIQGADAVVQFGKNHLILTGDCVYYWDIGQKTGNKMCEVGQYMTIGKGLLGSGLLTNESMGSILKNFGGATVPTSLDVQKILSTCKNGKEVKKELFALPQGVTFK